MLGDMKVRRVYSEEGNSYTHEPELDPEWSELAQLRWLASMHNIDIAPLSFEVMSAMGHSKTNGVTQEHRAYHVIIRGSGFGFSPMAFDHAASFMSDVSIGIQIERRDATR